MNKGILILSLLLIAALLVACIPQNRIQIKEPVTLVANEECIDSFDQFAFSTPDIDGPKQGIILPSKLWKIEATLPEDVKQGRYSIAAARTLDNTTQIWLERYKPNDIYEGASLSTNRFFVYDTISREWSSISARIENTIVFVDRLYVAEDGTIWGRNAWDSTEKRTRIPVLSKYNEKRNLFEFVQSTYMIPNGIFDLDGGSAISYAFWDVILLDPNDVFWFFVYQDAIYSFDTRTEEIIRHSSLDAYQKIVRASWTPDGNIYFLNHDDRKDSIRLEKGRLLRFDTQKNQIIQVRIPGKNWPAANSISVDKSGRLWLGVFGWMGVDGEWEEFHPQITSFLRLNEYLPLWRYYLPPSITMVSTDGKLWFSIPRSEEWKTLKSGIAWYDPQTNEGCWVTTEGYNVAEDKQHTVWLTAGGNLYRYSH